MSTQLARLIPRVSCVVGFLLLWFFRFIGILFFDSFTPSDAVVRNSGFWGGLVLGSGRFGLLFVYVAGASGGLALALGGAFQIFGRFRLFLLTVPSPCFCWRVETGCSLNLASHPGRLGGQSRQ